MVGEFVNRQPDIGRLLIVTLPGGASSVRSRSHAMKLAEDVVVLVRLARRSSMLHFFIAAPNGFTFFLGQNQPALGPAAIYEWDFEGTRSKSYVRGLTLK